PRIFVFFALFAFFVFQFHSRKRALLCKSVPTSGETSKNGPIFACFVYFRMFRDLSWISVKTAHV
ncbi:MAG: hypothetical protein MOB07_25205, partial [Acidobacteria bacterium]|nr:hypothetical protein [Acidobacteriota bacterium]